MNLYHAHPTDVCRVWHAVSGFLADGLRFSADEWDLSDLFSLLENGDQQLLIALDGERIAGAASVLVERHPKLQIAFITSVGGRGLINDAGFALISEWAESIGCSAVRGAVRPSMARLTRRAGFVQKYIIVERTL